MGAQQDQKYRDYQQVLIDCRTSLAGFPNFRNQMIDRREYDCLDYSLYSIRRQHLLINRPRVMLIAGFHGEEPAGVEAILKNLAEFLSRANALKLNLLVVPCANPWGCVHAKRHTPKSPITNGGYIHNIDALPPEFGRIQKLIQKFQPHFYLDLHEDNESGGVYTYCFGERSVGLEVLQAAVGKIPVETKPKMDDPTLQNADIRNGVVFEGHDGSSG